MDTLHIILNICSLISLLYILYIIKEIIKNILRKGKESLNILIYDNKIKKILLCVILLIGIGNFILDTWYKKPTIGSFYEKSEYTTKYYIYLYEDDNYINCKKLPAEIECTTNIQEKDLDYTITNKYYKTYYINKIFLPSQNPKFPEDYTIDNCIKFDDTDININKINKVIDTKGNTYYIELTKEKYLSEITDKKQFEEIDKRFQSTPYYQNSKGNK